jgi:hypothetical protein
MRSRSMSDRFNDLGGVLALHEPEEGGVHVTARLAEVVR